MALPIFSEERRKWWTLAAVSFGLFMIMLDNTVVNVALPAIQEDLGTGLSELQWIVTGYALSFAALMLIGGKLADAYGRRLIFVVGIVLFTGASLWCGLANSGDMLIAARVVQGVGAALMNPATLSIIAATFPPKERGMAIGIWAGVSALALAIGPLVGGLLTEHLSWHWIFFVNVPVGVVAIAASYLLITESRDETHENLDLPGLVTSALGLFALTYGLIEANAYGWTSARIVGSFVVAVVSLVSFVQIERRRRSPMLDLSLFRSGTYAGANVAMLLVALAMFGVFFFVSLYMQNVLGYSAVQTGAAFLPMTVLIILVAPFAGKASDKYGSRWLMTIGMVLLGVQLLYLSQLGVERHVLEPSPGLPRRRPRHGADDDPDCGGCDPRRAGAQVRCRLGRPERDAAGRRLGGDRADGRDRRRRGERPPRDRRLHGRLRASSHRRGGDRVRRLDRRVRARPPGGGDRGACADGGRSLNTPLKTRLPAAERRQAIVEAAMTVFSTGSYSGATTADIAREAGVSEPILYRHFASKRELYFACLDEAWSRLRQVFAEKIAAHEQGGAMPTPREMALRLRRTAHVLPPNLWIQALTEAGEDPEIARYLRRHMRVVHDFIADGIRRAQAAGGIAADRDPDAEAWIFLGGILLLSVADRLGGLLDDEAFAAIAAQRLRWLSGTG